MILELVDQVQREAANHHLKRTLGPFHLVLLGIGCTIGAGIYVMTGNAAANFAGPGVMLSFIIAGTACGFAALCYAELASTPEIACVSEGIDYAVEALCARLEALLNLVGIARSLANLGVDPHLVPTLAEEAAWQWTAHFNPRTVAAADFSGLYERAFERRGDGDAGNGSPGAV